MPSIGILWSTSCGYMSAVATAGDRQEPKVGVANHSYRMKLSGGDSMMSSMIQSADMGIDRGRDFSLYDDRKHYDSKHADSDNLASFELFLSANSVNRGKSILAMMDDDHNLIDSSEEAALPFSVATLLERQAQTDSPTRDPQVHSPRSSCDSVEFNIFDVSDIDESALFEGPVAHYNSAVKSIEHWEHGHTNVGPAQRTMNTVHRPRQSSSSRRIPYEDIEKHFHLPLAEASRALGIGMTCLKRKCRQYNIRSWPYRKVKSIDNLIKNIQTVTSTEESSIDDLARCVTELKVNMQIHVLCLL